jgi:hypothetical protein
MVIASERSIPGSLSEELHQIEVLSKKIGKNAENLAEKKGRPWS